jgi:6-phosphofructokinase 1
LPGLNAVIRAVVRKEGVYGHQILGFRHGWRGVLDGEVVSRRRARGRPIEAARSSTSRTNPTTWRTGWHECHAGASGSTLIVIGGEDTLGVAAALAAEGVAMSVSEAIDNDLLDRLHVRVPDRRDSRRRHRPFTPAESHTA